MNNKVLMGIVAVVVVAAAVFFLVGNKAADNSTTTTKNDSTSTTQQTNSDTSTQTTAEPRSINDILAMGTNQKCTFSDDGFSGTLYTSGGKARTDFTGSQDGSIVTSHTVITGSDVYIWIDGQANGFKTTTSALSQPGTGSG